MTEEELEQRDRDIYRQAFIDGLRSHAWWNDGIQVVGSMPTPLREVIAKVDQVWNYDPSRVIFTA